MATETDTRYQTWVCAACFDKYESAGQFVGMARYPEREQPIDCEGCEMPFAGDGAYSIIVEV